MARGMLSYFHCMFGSKRLILSATGAIPVAVSLLAAQAGAAPRLATEIHSHANYLRVSLCGVPLDINRQPFLRYDARQHYYLSYEEDGLGHTMLLGLCLRPTHWIPSDFDKNPNDAPDLEDDLEMPAQNAELPRLRSGAGIDIGDTPAQVTGKLGAQPSGKFSRGTTLVYSYKAPVTVEFSNDGEPWFYHAKYCFHNGHLWAIEYFVREEGTDY